LIEQQPKELKYDNNFSNVFQIDKFTFDNFSTFSAIIGMSMREP